MAKLMIISAGWEQLSLIKSARELGAEIIATHSDEKAAGFALSNKNYAVDAKNILRLYDIAVLEKIDGVTTDQCDYGYFAAAFIAERLGLPGPGVETAQQVTNKAKTRRRLSDNSIVLQPKFVICDGVRQAREAGMKIGFPVVVKPTDNRGSIGVAKANDERQLDAAFYDALAKSHARTVLVEEFIEGVEVAVDGYYLKNEGHRILSIASKRHSAEGLFDDEIITPAEISSWVEKQLRQINQGVVDMLGITYGSTHIEYMITDDDRIYLMEVHNRGGGVMISSHVNPVVSGINTAKCLVLDALGMPYKQIHLERKKAHTLIKFIRLPSGKILSAELKDREKLEDILLAFQIYAPMGVVLPPVRDCATRHGFITVCGDNREALYRNFEEVSKHMVLKYQGDFCMLD